MCDANSEKTAMCDNSVTPSGEGEVRQIGNHVHGISFKDKGRLLQFKYFFQYPYFRLFVAYFVTICNFVIYAEDPVSHSHAPCEIPVLGNAFSMIVTKYPPNGFSALKALMWITAIVVGIGMGKLIIHKWLLNKKFNVSMFSEDQGSWMICFLYTILMVLVSSLVYNLFLLMKSDMEPYEITAYIGAKNSTFMRAGALGTWFGDFITSWMVTDMMLQETKRYKRWKPGARRWWNKGKRRVVLFWIFSVILSVLVIVVVTTDILDWDKFNKDVVYTNELGRAFLASFILVMDFAIVMQDWDFPMFDSEMDIKLPGVDTAHIKFNFPDWITKNMVIHITGKWFQYGILFIVLLLDLNMWKNQIFYEPLLFGQYTGEDGKIFSVDDRYSLDNYMNATIFSYDWRNKTIDPLTNRTFLSSDKRSNSRYRGYSLVSKGMAFIPSILTFLIFGALIHYFGKKPVIPLKAENNTVMVDIENIDNGTDSVDKAQGDNVPVEVEEQVPIKEPDDNPQSQPSKEELDLKMCELQLENCDLRVDNLVNELKKADKDET